MKKSIMNSVPEMSRVDLGRTDSLQLGDGWFGVLSESTRSCVWESERAVEKERERERERERACTLILDGALHRERRVGSSA